MALMTIASILVVIGYYGVTEALDCQNEIEFRSNFPIEPWCMTNIDDCSLGSLRSNPSLSSLFNTSSWHSPEPEELRVTSFCQTDSNEDNRAGVRVTWKPPSDQGAMFIKGFEIRLEGHLPGPGYRCIVLKLIEGLTQSVVDSEVSGTIYPVKRNHKYTLSLFSLPRSSKSGIVFKQFRSYRCENAKSPSSNWTTNLYTVYDENQSTLNVSFTPPPRRFNFTQFKLTILHLNSSHRISSVYINKTFHVFSSIGLGHYQLWLEPYNPHPFDVGLCRCKNDRDKCETCRSSRKDIVVAHQPLTTTPRNPRNGKRKWTTKVVIKKKNWNKKRRFKAEKKASRGDETKGDKPNRIMIRVVLPLLVGALLLGMVPLVIWLVFVFRRRRRSGHCCKSMTSFEDKSPTRAADDQARERRMLIVVDATNIGKHGKGSQGPSEFINIIKGIVGPAVDIHKIKYSSRFSSQIHDCTRKLLQQREHGNKRNLKEHDCSETSLIEGKPSSAKDLKLDCCLRRARVDAIVLLLVFVDGSTPASVLDTCRRAFDSVPSETINYECICVSKTKEEIPRYSSNMTVYSYKEELSPLLSFVKNTLVKSESKIKSNKDFRRVEETPNKVNTSYKGSTDMCDKYVDLKDAPDSEGQWMDWPEVVHISRAPWFDSAARRKRYVSSDSGWGTSEHSWRSTPIEEVNEGSNKSSLQSISEPDHCPVSPLTPGFINTRRGFDQSPTFTSSIDTDPISFYTDPSRSMLKCPSEFSFIPPDDLKSFEPEMADELNEDNTVCTRISDIKCVPCNNFKDSSTEWTKAEKRQSPSMDSLMEMMKAINDESKRFMEHEANVGDVYSVFEGVA